MQAPFTFRAQARLLDFMRQAGEPGLINLAAGVPGLDALPFEALREATQAALAADGPAIFAYHHPEGDHALRDLLAARLAARGVEGLKGADLVTTTGCTQALQGMLSILVKPGEIVACEAPAYYGLLELIAEAGARILPIPVEGAFGIDPERADDLFTKWKPKCLVVCTALSNPSGATLPLAQRPRLVEVCRKHGVRLIEDDIYGELVDGGAPRPCRADDDGSTVSYVTSVSKSISPGLRVGFCIPGTPELHDAFAARKTQQDLHSSVVSEAVLREFIARGSLEPHLEMLRERNRRRRELALAVIERAFPKGSRVDIPCGGYMLWATLPPGVEMARVKEEARQKKVVFAGGEVFFAAPPPQPCMRLNCARASEEELERGLELLGRLASGAA